MPSFTCLFKKTGGVGFNIPEMQLDMDEFDMHRFELEIENLIHLIQKNYMVTTVNCRLVEAIQDIPSANIKKGQIMYIDPEIITSLSLVSIMEEALI